MEVNSTDVTELVIRQVLWQMHMNTWEFLNNILWDLQHTMQKERN